MHRDQHLGTCLGLCVCSLLSAAVELAWGSTAVAVRPFVLDEMLQSSDALGREKRSHLGSRSLTGFSLLGNRELAWERHPLVRMREESAFATSITFAL